MLPKSVFILSLCIFIESTHLSPLSRRDGRIIDGSDASPGEFPYHVGLRRSGSSLFCAGALIKPHWVLTTAHCVVDRLPNTVLVIVGNVLLSQTYPYSVREITMHEDYSSNNLLNDIALIRTVTDLVLTESVQPIALASRTYESGSGFVTGWGVTSSGSTPDNLKYFKPTLISLQSCISQVSANEDTVCTQESTGGVLCSGDWGAPLASEDKSELIGIALTYFGFCGSIYPELYVNVFHHRNWIEANTD